MAYRLSAGNIRVVLESPEGNATLLFKKAKLNELLDAQTQLDAVKDKPIDRIKLSFEQVLSRLISVDDMLDSDGEAVTVDRIKALDFDPATMNAIVEGYNLAIGLGDKPKSEEKKDLTPE
jgi:hypothetical protein